MGELCRSSHFNGQMRPNAIWPAMISSAELRKIRVPALLLLGDNELLYDPQAVLRRAQRRMRNPEARIIPGAHHIAAMAKPDEVNARMIEFPSANSGGGSVADSFVFVGFRTIT